MLTTMLLLSVFVTAPPCDPTNLLCLDVDPTDWDGGAGSQAYTDTYDEDDDGSFVLIDYLNGVSHFGAMIPTNTDPNIIYAEYVDLNAVHVENSIIFTGVSRVNFIDQNNDNATDLVEFVTDQGVYAFPSSWFIQEKAPLLTFLGQLRAGFLATYGPDTINEARDFLSEERTDMDARFLHGIHVLLDFINMMDTQDNTSVSQTYMSLESRIGITPYEESIAQ